MACDYLTQHRPEERVQGMLRLTVFLSASVQDVDLVERNENGAELGRPIGTAPLQPIHKLNERSPDAGSDVVLARPTTWS